MGGCRSGRFTPASQGAIRARAVSEPGKILNAHYPLYPLQGHILFRFRLLTLGDIGDYLILLRPGLGMSRQWEPSTQNVSQREESWLQSVVGTHNMFCGCGDPGFHLALLLHSEGRHAGGPGGPPPPPAPRPPSVGGPGNDLPRFLPLPGLPPAPEEPENPPAPCPGGPGEDAGGAAAAGSGGDDWAAEDIAELLADIERVDRG